MLGPTVERLVQLAEGGTALEMAIGTGRVAVPLAAAGVPVTGIELGVPGLRVLPPGQRAEVFRSPHRYAWPAELDLMAQLAGLELEARHADWAGAPFTAESTSHVSVYRLPPAG